MDEETINFCIGHHDSSRPLPVTQQTVLDAHAANYDMVTSPITNSHFHSRVLALLSSSIAEEFDKFNGNVSFQNKTSHLHIAPLTPEDTPLTPDDSMSQIIATTSPWIDLCSPDPIILDISNQVLKLEVTYAAFCGIIYLAIPGPRGLSSASAESGILQYARAILDVLSDGPFMQIYIWLPMIDHLEDRADNIGDLASFTRQEFLAKPTSNETKFDVFGAWAAWDTIRSLCKYNSRLFVALQIPRFLPPVPIQSRWFSEPVRILTMTSHTFTTNAKGYPVLSKPHQALISRLMRSRVPPWFLLCDVASLLETSQTSPTDTVAPTNPSSFPTPAEAFPNQKGGYNQVKDPHAHLSYMRNLQSKQPTRSLLEKFGAGYQDYLQAPLQPLTVNLESITYEVFEKDPIKYEWYEKAIARALHDWIEQGKPSSGPDGRVVVAVVGAGRGPLVTRALQAAEGVDVEIDMWALEKNPNAFVLLQRHNRTTWNNRVSLVKSDMRTWQGPARPIQPSATKVTQLSNQSSFTGDIDVDRDYLLATAATTPAQTHYKIDILISELLGSFADNELSPECLDGVQHLLSPTHGISIPASYSAHLTPISAPKLHADILTQSISNPNAPDIPYVVMLNAIDFLSTTPSASSPKTKVSQPAPPPTPDIQTAWSFMHPTSTQPTVGTNAHNARHSKLIFPIPNRGTCHGLAGYFETVLYDKVELSTNPNTMDAKSEGMISWFPIFFPLKTPLPIPDEAYVTVHMWRQTDDRKVWYEWLVEVFVDLPSRTNPTKLIRAKVGCSDLHSSIKEACLM